MEIKDVFGNRPTLETGQLVLRKVTLDDAQGRLQRTPSD